MTTLPRLLLALAVATPLAWTAPTRAQEEPPPADNPATIDTPPSDPAQQPDPPRRRPRGQFPRGGQPPQQAPEPLPAAKPDEAKPSKPDVYFAITGATVHTVSGPTLEHCTILCKNGKIAAIGPGVKIPEKAEILDAAGFHVYPGLVAARSVAIIGGDPPEDTTDPFTLPGTAALAAGITTVLTGNTAAKVTFGTVDDMIVRRNIFENLRYRSNDPSGKKRVRESFERVRQYMRDAAAFEEARRRDPSAKAPDDRVVKSGEGAVHFRLMKHEAVAQIDADTASEILQVCALAEEFDFPIVIRGGREAWTVATQMSRAGAAAIITPRSRDDPDRTRLRPNGGTIENASTLQRHGIPFAIVPSIPGISFGGLGGRDLFQLNLEAAFAVRGGLSEQDAIRAITLDAARVLGVDDRVGSIQVGKDADFVVLDRPNLLDYTALARWTVVNATVMYDKSKEPLLRHIRPNGGEDTPAPADFWPRRLGADQ
jgi:imidazolonepropionase-like amidohydrolase